MKTQYIPDGWGFDKWVRPINKNDRPRNPIKYIVIGILMLLVCLAFFSCKAPKDTALQTKQKEDKNIVNDLQLNYDAKLNEAISQALEKAIREKLNIKVNQVKYDTDKPIDPETGKPPIKEETNVDLTKETEEDIKENMESQTSQSEELDIKDKGKQHIKTQNELNEEITTSPSWWQKLISGIVLTALGIWGAIWGIKRLLKWKLKL